MDRGRCPAATFAACFSLVATSAGAQTAPAPAESREPGPAAQATPVDAAPARTIPAASSDAPRQLAAGAEATFRPGINFQGWFLYDRAQTTTSTFRIRRMELSVKGEVLQGRLAYAVMFDPAKVWEPDDKVIPVESQSPAGADPAKPEQVTVKQSSSALSVLQDAFVTWQSPWVDVTLGQFKTPVSLEGSGPANRLLFAERALAARTYGDKRDLGLRLGKKLDRVAWQVGLFNGAGLNRLDANNAKDLAIRLEAYPVRGLTLAAVSYDTIGQRAEKDARDRWEGDVRYERGPVLVQAEYLRAQDVDKSGKRISGQGWYAAAAVFATEDLQVAARYGALDPDVSKDGDQTWHADVGLNWYFLKHEAKLQLDYARIDSPKKGSATERVAEDQLTLCAQASY